VVMHHLRVKKIRAWKQNEKYFNNRKVTPANAGSPGIKSLEILACAGMTCPICIIIS